MLEEELTDKIFSILFSIENQNLSVETQKEMVLKELKLFKNNCFKIGVYSGLNKAKSAIEACLDE